MITQWHNCYDESWQDIIVPEAFSHPAKMSRGLLRRILQHAQGNGWIAPGDIILDPFGGIGSTGILGAYDGYGVVCVELEPKFVDLAAQNFHLHWPKWQRLGCPEPIIIQGDSRKLCEIVSRADCLISSPPYIHTHNDDPQINGTIGIKGRDYARNKYGQTPGQLGAMKAGDVDAVIGSPPYAATPIQGGGDCLTRDTRHYVKKTGKWPKRGLSADNVKPGYGQTPGNLGNMKPGDISAIVSSPPWEKQQEGGGVAKSVLGKSDYPVWDGPARTKKAARAAHGFGYQNQGETTGQLGNQQGDTFWSAAKEIVQQCYQVLKAGGVAIWVTKAFVRNGKRVDFPGDWKRLCESVGFVTMCEHHAMLFKERRLRSLFGDMILSRTKRNSFFRKLIERKTAWKNYWKTVDKKEQRKWLREAKLFLDEVKKHDKKLDITKATILTTAMGGAFKASGEDEHDWNEEIRIDYENVLCMRKEQP